MKKQFRAYLLSVLVLFTVSSTVTTPSKCAQAANAILGAFVVTSALIALNGGEQKTDGLLWIGATSCCAAMLASIKSCTRRLESKILS